MAHYKVQLVATEPSARQLKRIERFYLQAYGYTTDLTFYKLPPSREGKIPTELVEGCVKRLQRYYCPVSKIGRTTLSNLRRIIEETCNDKNQLITTAYRSQILRACLNKLKQHVIDTHPVAYLWFS